MRFIVTGRVHPERAEVCFSTKVWTSTDGVVTVSCDSSQVTVVIEHQKVTDSITAFLLAQHIAQAIVSVLGFALATGYWIEMIQVIDESGTPHVFGVRTRELMMPVEEICPRAEERSKRDLLFRMALRDYASAMIDAFTCSSYCFRAIEAVKSAFGPGTDAECWSRMHDALGTNREDIDTFVKDFADPVRHGNWAGLPQTSSQQRLEMLRITRDVLLRYLKYEPPAA